MAKNERARRRRAEKKRERAKRLARARNLRRNEARYESYEPYEPDVDAPFADERFARRMLLQLARDGEVNDERVERFMAENAGRPWYELADEIVERLPGEQAQELAYCAMETLDEDEALDLAEEALDLDPSNCDARYVIASVLRDEMGEETWLASLYEAVEVGWAALGGEAGVNPAPGELGAAVFARPYLRTRGRLATALRGLGRLDEAAAEFEELVRLDRYDTLGARDALIGVQLARGELERARGLLDFEPTDGERALLPMLVSWGRVAERWRSGDLDGARAALESAREFCPSLLPRMASGPGLDDDHSSDAAQLIELFQLEHEANAELRAWLLEQARPS